MSELAESNRKLISLDLFVLVLSLTSARLPRYVAALEMHASLAGTPSATTLGVDAAEASTMMDGVKSLKRALRWIQMVKTEAIDMAKKLDRFSEQD